MERINQYTLKELLEQEKQLSEADRERSFARNIKESMAL